MRYNHFVSIVLFFTCAPLSEAQIVTATAAIPSEKVLSPGGVDLRSAEFVAESVDLSIGPEGAGGFTFIRIPRSNFRPFTSNWHYKVWRHPNPSGGFYYQIENRAIAKTFFSADNTNFTDSALVPGDGITKLQLLGSGSSRYFVHTDATGTVTRFQTSTNGVDTWAEEIKHPDGVTYSFTYDTGGPANDTTRLRRVVSNAGFQLILEYYASPNQGKIYKACVLNAAFTTPPAAHTCPAGTRNVTYTYSGTRFASMTDALGNVWSATNTYTTSSAPFQESFYKPGYGSPYLTNYYTAPASWGFPLVPSQQNFADGRVFTYQFDWIGHGDAPNGAVLLGLGWTANSVNTTTVRWKTYQGNVNYVPAVAGPDKITDPLSRATTWTYDAAFSKVLSIAKPNGLKSTYTYNSNRNITNVQRTVGALFSDGPLNESYTYDCTVALNCKKPATSTNARGFTTNYTYDPVHGGLLTETLPAPTSVPGSVRPQRRYAWNQYYAWYRNTAGVLVQAATPIWLVSSISECRTGSSCAGTADEIKTTYLYGTSGIANNLLLTQRTVASGNGAGSSSVAWTYDANGDMLTEDGPLSGPSDTTVWKYDGLRQVVGAISPDPDGVNPLANRARRNTYDGAGRVTNVETGYTNGQSDSAFASFTALSSVETVFDIFDRPTKVSVKSGGTTYAVTQHSYDAFGRHECTAIRMNPSEFGNLPASACSPYTPGSYGSDRITRFYYDAANQLTKTQVAVGTADAADDSTVTYTANGKVETVTDAEGNRTTYTYDGHDRLVKTSYPLTAQGSQQSSSSNYELFTYDANANLKSRQLRDLRTIFYDYDNLDRVTLKNLPGAEVDVSYSQYDLQGNVLSMTQGATLTFTFNIFGQTTSETGPLGTMSYDFDAAGRRTTTTWPDSFYVTREYYDTGELKTLRENGALSGPGVLASYSYDNRGFRTLISRGNGTTTTYQPDAIGRMYSLSHDLALVDKDATTTFNYNPANQISSLTRTNDLYAWQGHYNANQATSVNGLNQTTSAAGASLMHDDLGNVTVIGANSYSYTSENRLVSGPSGAAFVYDAVGRLYQSSKAGQTSRYQYDGKELVGEYNDSNILQRRYVIGAVSDEPSVWYEGSGVSDRRWYYQDERKSVVAVSNGSGSSLGINTYDEYGMPGSANFGRRSYTGQAWLPEIGMYYFKARIQAPALGKFMQTDPVGLGDGMNMYSYVSADPINSIDPTGQAAVQIARYVALPALRVVGVAIACYASGFCQTAGSAIEEGINVLLAEEGSSDPAPAPEQTKEPKKEIKSSTNTRPDGQKEVRVDEEGKVHGTLPKPNQVAEDDLENSIEALETSIKTRVTEQENFPAGDPNGTEEEQNQARERENHLTRAERENSLLEALRERLRRRQEQQDLPPLPPQPSN